MRRILIFLSLVIITLFSFRPVPKEESNQLVNVSLLYSTTTSPGCYGIFMYNETDYTEYFFTFSGSYGTLGTVTPGTYFVSINEITPYCDGYNNRTFQVGCATAYNAGTQEDFFSIPINSGCSYVIIQ